MSLANPQTEGRMRMQSLYHYSTIIPALWLAWAACWIMAASRVKPTRWREPFASRACHLIPTLFCWALLVVPRAFPPALTTRFRPPGRLSPLVGTLLVVAGLALTGWARWHIGRNWSGIITLKQDHTLIRTGPYRSVRHPIYSGLLLALIGTALAIGEWRGVLAVAAALVAFLWKIRVEEAYMLRTFPEYDAYRRHSASLIPLLY